MTNKMCPICDDTKMVEVTDFTLGSVSYHKLCPSCNTQISDYILSVKNIINLKIKYSKYSTSVIDLKSLKES